MNIENCIKNKIKNEAFTVKGEGKVQTSVFIVSTIKTSQESLTGGTLPAIKEGTTSIPTKSGQAIKSAGWMPGH